MLVGFRLRVPTAVAKASQVQVRGGKEEQPQGAGTEGGKVTPGITDKAGYATLGKPQHREADWTGALPVLAAAGAIFLQPERCLHGTSRASAATQLTWSPQGPVLY